MGKDVGYRAAFGHLQLVLTASDDILQHPKEENPDLHKSGTVAHSYQCTASQKTRRLGAA